MRIVHVSVCPALVVPLLIAAAERPEPPGILVDIGGGQLLHDGG